MKQKNLKPKFDKALKEFVEIHKKNHNVLAIFVSGSYIHSKPDKNSDLDVYVLLKESKTRERGNTWINGVEVEYFINPIKQVRHYFKTETGVKSPATAHMFANSLVLYKKGNEIDKLIKEAKKILKKPGKKLSKIDIEREKYFLDDIEKDLEDVYLRKDEFVFNYIAMEILRRSLYVFFKIKRKSREKSKRLLTQLGKLDSKFKRLYHKAVLEKNVEKKYLNLRNLVKYVEHHLGGKRAKEWKLKGKCTY